jgi:hypothetical protein
VSRANAIVLGRDLPMCFLMVWADSDNGSTVALQASGRGSIPRRSTKELGLKVFMDARRLVTP